MGWQQDPQARTTSVSTATLVAVITRTRVHADSRRACGQIRHRVPRELSWPGANRTLGKQTNRKEIRTMKKLLAVAGLGAAIAVGALMGAGAANANEGSFIYAANNEGWYDNNPGGTMRFGPSGLQSPVFGIFGGHGDGLGLSPHRQHT